MKRAMPRSDALREHLPKKFARPFSFQLLVVLKRTLKHDWRTPSYLYSKILLTLRAVREDLFIYLRGTY